MELWFVKVGERAHSQGKWAPTLPPEDEADWFKPGIVIAPPTPIIGLRMSR